MEKLNDGFFDLDEFNAMGSGDEMNPEDEFDEDNADEEIDYFADPDLLPDDDEDEDDEDEDDEGEEKDVGEIMYDDFYKKPRHIRRKERRDQEEDEEEEEEGDDDEDDEERQENSDYDLDDVDDMDIENADADQAMANSQIQANDNTKPVISRQAQLQQSLARQIAQYEKENVQSRHWTLLGEVEGMKRPKNSILDADIEIERSMVPVHSKVFVPEHTVEALEDLIKKRIVEQRFDDEIVKRGRNAIKTKDEDNNEQETFNQKSDKSLSQIYSDQYLNVKTDDKREKEYKEISRLFAKVSRQLDALTNWHFTPKPSLADPKISVKNVSTITVEEVQPGAHGDSNLLAPQEVFGGHVKGQKEIKGAPVGKTELDKQSRKSLRRREKTRLKKKAIQLESKRKERLGGKEDIVDTLRKGGVKVITKNGGLQSNLTKRSGRGVNKR